jgi:D-glycero-D-manno-heptose 1,7-bisphosphate phosphatase
MKTIILDRDGVINQDSDAYIKTPDEWIPIPGSLEAIARLGQAGYRILVATNQSGVARGLFDSDTLAAIHQKMQSAIQALGGKLDGIYHCPHAPGENCPCRKPKPGLLLQIQQDFSLDLRQTIIVGDSLKDLQAAIAVGAKPILVLTGKGTKTASELKDDQQIDTYPDLAHYIDALLARPS